MCGNGVRCVAQFLYTHGVPKDVIEIDIVVAAAVHFGKVQLHKVPPCCAVWKESNKRIKKKE